MEFKTTEQRYREFLDTLPLSTLRILGRQYGVSAASSSNKRALIGDIIAILTGKVSPAPRTNRGAPVKQTYVDPAILERLNAIRTRAEEDDLHRKIIFEVSAPDGEFRLSYDEPVYAGILEVTSAGYGFVRTHGSRPSVGEEDVFLSAPFIHAMGLRAGDYIACTAHPQQGNEAAAIGELLSVNGLPQGKYSDRPAFEALTPVYPTEKIALSAGDPEPSLRMLDLFVPIGKGQRVLMAAPPGTGRTALLQSIGRAVLRSGLMLVVVLIDGRPEDVTKSRADLHGATFFSSTFDEGAGHHLRIAKLASEYAKRQVEHGKDVVILLDSLTKYVRACDLLADGGGRTVAGLDPAAFSEPKRFFGAARNTSEAGSLTIVATATVQTGNAADDLIYEQFRGAGNADIVLSAALAQRGVFPAIDLFRSGTRKGEALLSEQERSAVCQLRAHGEMQTEQVIRLVRETENNADLIARLPDLLRAEQRE